MLIAANRVGKCATFNTRIDTPDGPQPLWKLWGRQVYVNGPDHPVKVLAWVKKPAEECFRITLADGRWFEAPRGHRMQVGKEFFSLQQICEQLPASVPNHLRSNSGSDRLVRALSAGRLSGRFRGFLGRCLAGFRRCGGQLLTDQDGVQVFFPLPNDAPQHNVVWYKKGGLGNKCTDTLLRFFDRLSNLDGVLHAWDRFSLSRFPSWMRDALHNFLSTQNISLCHSQGCLQSTFEQEFQGQSLFSSSANRVDNVLDIISVHSIGVHDLYDMEVEGSHYCAAGLVHHNTFSAAFEIACHATGIYPDWWQGVKFKHAPLIWVASITNETSRDIVQKELIGEPEGTGAILGEKIIKTHKRQAGVSNVLDRVTVRHLAGVSEVIFKTYDQGWRKFQGTAPDVIWMDEEPEDYKVFTESLTRILTSKGRLLVTFTPLLGETDLVLHFNEGIDGTYVQTATWDDAPHLSEEDKKRFEASFPPHEREARTKGVPMMGEGRLFPFSEDEIKCEPFQIPNYFAQICGIDFGIDHPGAGAWLAWDRDRDILYVTDCYKKPNWSATLHAEAVNRRGKWIPVSWPHDGVNKEKGTGQQLKDIWINHGVNMLAMSARYKNEKGGAQPVEPMVAELYERIETGRFKVFSNLSEWFSEYRNLHRKDGKIVAVRDDIFKATCYAVMMRRYATPQFIPKQQTYTRAIV